MAHGKKKDILPPARARNNGLKFIPINKKIIDINAEDLSKSFESILFGTKINNILPDRSNKKNILNILEALSNSYFQTSFR